MAKTKVYVVYYSLHGHVGIVAREVHRGANSVQGVEATLWQVPETLPDRILDKMKAPSKEDIPVIRPEQLVEADGFLFGSPSRFGMMAAQLLAFFNATYELCQSQALAGKPAGIFWSTGFHGGGQELTAFTAITQLAHHGMLFVPLGYTSGISMFEMSEVKGGSSYGAGTYAGDGTRVPTVLELQQAFHQGVCLTMLASFVVIHYKKRHTVWEPSSIFTPDEHFRISYSKLEEATNSFSNTNLLGVGTYGSVYKGILDQNGTVVAVKVLNLQQRGGSKSFISECTALRNVHHRNLVKILTSCSNVDSQGNDFQALLFEFMPNGNLENWL